LNHATFETSNLPKGYGIHEQRTLQICDQHEIISAHATVACPYINHFGWNVSFGVRGCVTPEDNGPKRFTLLYFNHDQKGWSRLNTQKLVSQVPPCSGIFYFTPLSSVYPESLPFFPTPFHEL